MYGYKLVMSFGDVCEFSIRHILYHFSNSDFFGWKNIFCHGEKV